MKNESLLTVNQESGKLSDVLDRFFKKKRRRKKRRKNLRKVRKKKAF